MAGNYICEYGTASHVEAKSYSAPAGAKKKALAILAEDAKRASILSKQDYDAIRELQMRIKGVDVYERMQEFQVVIDTYYEMTRVIRLYRRGVK